MAQYYDFGFSRNDSIIVLKQNGSEYKNPWAGGLNNCQFFEMDIDLNDTNDLIVFDKHGNKILSFLKINTLGNQQYKFAPEYSDMFPKFRYWVKSADYNNDGKLDIFSYTLAGIKVWKNISDTSLKFKIVSQRLVSDYGSGFVNLFVNEADYPAIADFDGDNDLDILNFSSLGKFLDYHQNLSMENYGVTDSLNFSLNSHCWGKFSENESSNILHLNDDCSSKSSNFKEQERHTGSTLLAKDLNGDGLMDLIIGDVDYPHLISLINGGTIDTAKMISQDTLFPSAAEPVRLYSMPCAAIIDVDFDNVSDLLISPFDASRSNSENKKSIWFYKNIGSETNPNFVFQTSDFIQESMIDLGSGAYPTFFDYNNDGLLDLIVGNWGSYDSSNYIGSFLHTFYSSSIALFKNIGTLNQPKFQLITEDLGDLKKLGLKGFYPAPADIDNDGDMDLLVGNETGKLIYLENTGIAGNTPTFNTPVFNYQNISAFSYSSPQLFDLDRDGKRDLLIGDSLGKIHYYHNNGTSSNPIFSIITDTLGGVNVRNVDYSYYGYSTPCFFRRNDTTYLFVGSESGFIFSYKNIDNNLNGKFTLIDDSTFFVRNNNRVPIYEGFRSGVAVADINNDLFPDLILGNYTGGLTYYRGTLKPLINIDIQKYSDIKTLNLKIFPNPVNNYFKIISNQNSNNQYTLSIFDLAGKLLLSKDYYLSETIDINSFKAGIYFVKIKNNIRENWCLKIVKI